MTDECPSMEDVLNAHRNVRSEVVRTPLLTSHSLNEQLKARIYFKVESLQRTGSFKFRGAYNKLLNIPESDHARGVVSCSSGNHAQGVALAAKILNIPASIVMPSDAPDIKVRRTRSYGAEVVFYDRVAENREQIALELCESKGATFVHPYDDVEIIAGQGTSALEAIEQLSEKGKTADSYLVCTGGGGLTAGTAIALEGRSPDTGLFTVEPEEFDDHVRSFASGRRESNGKASGSICDALLASTPGEITFQINRTRVEDALVVSDRQAMNAVAFAYRELKLIVEPGGAAALAAVLAGKLELSGTTAIVVLTGGNMDVSMLANCLNNAEKSELNL